MLKYKQNRTLIEINCDHCDIKFEKPLTEYNRNLNLNRKNYCSRSCCGKSFNNINHLRQLENNINISDYSNNKKDEYTGFRYYYRNAKSRFKEFDLTLQDIKNQWELQNGICPYTGFELKLYNSKLKNPYELRASLDRIDSSIGYIKENIEFISLPINYLKNDQLSKQEVFELLAKIAPNFH